MPKSQVVSFIANFIIIFRDLISYAIIARIILSWFTLGGQSQGRIALFLHDTTEPVLRVARVIPHRIGMIDLSPLIALIGLDLFGRLIIILLSNV